MSSKRRARAVGRRPAGVGQKQHRSGDEAALAAEGVAKDVTRLLEEIRSVDVEWPVVQVADEHGSRVERLQREEERLAAELRAMESERQKLESELESAEEQKREALPYHENVAELKGEVRRLQSIVTNEALVQETVDLLTEEQELLVTQAEQAEHQSHVLVAKAEELASLVLEDNDDIGVLGKASLEQELKRIVADAEKAHDRVDSCKAAAAEQKQALTQSQIELVEAKEAGQQAQMELKDAHQELLVASREAADMVNAARKRHEDIQLQMDELQDRKLQVGAKKVKIAERIKAELKAIAEAEAIAARAQEDEAEELARMAKEAKEQRRREELARAAAVRKQQKRASSGIPAPAYQAPAHTPRRKPLAGATPKRKPADAPGSSSPRPIPRSPATRIPLAAALEAAAHEEFVPQTPGAQVVKAHVDEAKAIDSPRTPSRQKLPQRLAGSASTTPSRQNLPARLSTGKKSGRSGGTSCVHTSTAEVQQLVMPDRAARDVLFDSIDINGNGGLSLAEIDKAIVAGLLGKAMHYPDFDNKPAVMRAYHAADISNDGFIERSEFMNLLRYLVYFNNLWHKFEEIDNDHDRRLDADEFAHGCGVLGIDISPKEARAEFQRCDTDGGGMVLFGEFCKWAADRHIDGNTTFISEGEAKAAQAADAEAARRKQKEAEFAHLTRIERRRKELAAREEAIEPKQKRLDASQKATKQERDTLERQRTMLRRKNAALLKQERQLREERKEIVKAQKKLRKLRENSDKLQKASKIQTKDSKLQARKVKEKLAKLEQAEELQSSLVSEEHTHLDEEMSRLREARLRFLTERREAEDGLRAACEAAGVEWVMKPLPSPAEEAALAAAQQVEKEQRNSRLHALLTVASAPSARGAVEVEDIDYDEADDDDDDDEPELSAATTDLRASSAGDIDYDEDDEDGDTEDDEAEVTGAASELPASSTVAAGDDIDYDEVDDEGDTEDDEVGVIEAESRVPASSAVAGDGIDYDEEDTEGDTEDDEIDHRSAPQAAAPLGPPPARAAPLLNSDSDSSTDDDDEGEILQTQPQANVPNPTAIADSRKNPELNSDSSSEEDV